MKIIHVYFDDYRPLTVGRVVVNDEDVDRTVGLLNNAIGGDEGYKVEVEEPDTVESVIEQLREIMADD